MIGDAGIARAAQGRPVPTGSASTAPNSWTSRSRTGPLAVQLQNVRP
jgi:hypothetical protein